MEAVDTNQLIQDPSVAHTEAKVVQSIENLSNGQASLIDTIIEAKVKEEYREKFQGTAKTDIAAQITEKLEQTSPQLIEAIRTKVDAVGRITQYYSNKDESIDWDQAYQKAERVIRIVGTIVDDEMKEARKKESDLPIYKAFGTALDDALDKHFLTRDDSLVFGDIMTTVLSSEEIEDQLFIQSPSINKAANDVNIEEVYNRQMKYDKGVAATVSPVITPKV